MNTTHSASSQLWLAKVWLPACVHQVNYNHTQCKRSKSYFGESRRTKPPGNSFFLSLTLSHTHTHTCPGILRNVISLQAISYIGQHTSTRCCIIHIFYDSCDQLTEMYKTWNINVRDVNEGWCCQGDKKVHYERFSDLAEINSSMPVPLFESPD